MKQASMLHTSKILEIRYYNSQFFFMSSILSLSGIEELKEFQGQILLFLYKYDTMMGY